MAHFVLIVDLEIKPEKVEAFIEAAKGQAEQSLRLEPGCLRFDIIQRAGEPHRITHYEIFEDEAAFEAHAKMPHTTAFGKSIESLIVGVELRRGTLSASMAKPVN